jgi:hypothetical protein
VGAEPRPQRLVPALADDVQVEVAERRQEPVRVVDRQRAALGVGHVEAVAQRQLPALDLGHEDAGRMHLHERLAASVVEHHGHLLRSRAEHADDDAVAARMRSEVTVRL